MGNGGNTIRGGRRSPGGEKGTGKESLLEKNFDSL